MQQWFQSSFELTGYITIRRMKIKMLILQFQSSFELTGYITKVLLTISSHERVSKLFRAYRLYNAIESSITTVGSVSKLFRAYRLYNL